MLQSSLDIVNDLNQEAIKSPPAMELDSLDDLDSYILGSILPSSSSSSSSSGSEGILSPPDSTTTSPTSLREAETSTSVSTTFFPGANVHIIPFDLTIVSSDHVYFYVHSDILNSVSDNEFAGLLSMPNSAESKSIESNDQVSTTPPPLKSVSESATVTNIVLHAVYDLPCDEYSPNIEDIEKAFIALRKYGVSIAGCISPPSNLFKTLLASAKTDPMKVYALAASHSIHDLCISVSPLLLSYPLGSITDEVSEKMGPIYLKRLFELHSYRVTTLKDLLLPPPQLHEPNLACDRIAQKKLTRAWALACAYLTWDARPDIGWETINAAFGSLREDISCPLCKGALNERMSDLLISWSLTKRTI